MAPSQLQLPSFPILLSFLFFFLLLLSKALRKSSSKPRRSQRLPPGPWNLPLVGSLHHLLGDLPFRAFRRLARSHGPLMLLRLGQVDAVVASSREAADDILKHQGVVFAARPDLVAPNVIGYGSSDMAWSPYGPYWKQLRKLCFTELLSARRIRSFSAIRSEETLDLMRDIAAATPPAAVDLSEKLFGLSNAIVCRAAFGRRRAHRERFVPLIKQALVLAAGFCFADTFPSLKFVDVLSGANLAMHRLHRRMDAILTEIIDEHRSRSDTTDTQHKVDDLVDVLLRLKDDPELEVPLTMDNIKAVIFDMFLAGTETSSTVLEWAMSELVKNPEAMAKAQSEVREVLKGKNRVEEGDIAKLHYMKLVISETLRLHPPVPLLPRVCREDCEVMGYEIAAGTRVFVNAWAMGRDPQYWGGDAESFRPERFDGVTADYTGGNGEYLPFGAGRRMCPGVGFGLATVELAMAHLLFYFDWELPDGMRPEELDMAETMALIAPRKTELKLLATTRIPLANVHMQCLDSVQKYEIKSVSKT